MAGTGTASSRGGELYELQNNEDDRPPSNIFVAALPSDNHLRSRGFSLSNAQGPGGQVSANGPSASPRLHNGTSAIEQDDVVTAIASPSLYSSRSAARRFPSSTMYKDGDLDTTNSWITLTQGASDRRSSGDVRAPYSTATESSILGHGLSATLHRGSESSKVHSAKASRASGYSDRSAYLWKKRRKRWARLLRNFALAGGSTLSKPRLSVILAATLLLLYLYFRALSSEDTDAHAAARSAFSSAVRPTIDLPAREWWQSQPEAEFTTERNRQRRTSYVTPRHTYSQLQSLPSRYAFNASSSQELPSVKAIIDCTRVDASELSPDRLEGISGDLDTEKMPFLSVDIIIREPAQRLQENSKARYATHVADSARHHIHQVSKSQSSFLLLLDCPSDHALGAIDGDIASLDHFGPLETLIRAAGSDEHAGHILTLAGLSGGRHDEEEAWTLLARSANVRRDPGGAVKPISVSTILQYASAPMLFHTSWLDQAEIQDVPGMGQASAALYFATILSQRRKIYGLPIPNRLESEPTSSGRWQKEHLAIRKYLSNDNQQVNDMKLQTERDASPARVAVFLADSDARQADWEDLICSFHDEQKHGHEIRLFLPPTSTSVAVGSMLGACPDVAYRRATEERVNGFKPDICLISQNVTIQFDATCVQIVLPPSQIRHLDWLPTLSLESLQSTNPTSAL